MLRRSNAPAVSAVRGRGGRRVDTVAAFLPDIAGERFRFLGGMGLECVETPLDVLFQVAGFLDDSLFEAGESPIDVTHLIAEEDVPDLLEVAGAGESAAVTRSASLPDAVPTVV